MASTKDLLLKRDQAKLKTLRERLPAVAKRYGDRSDNVLKAKRDIEKLQDKVYMRTQDIRYNIKDCTFEQAIERLLLQCNEHQTEFVKLNELHADPMTKFKLADIKQFISDNTWAALEEAEGFIKQMVNGLIEASAKENQELIERINAFQLGVDYFTLIGFQYELAEAYGALQARWEEEVFRSTELFAQKVELLVAEIDRGNSNV